MGLGDASDALQTAECVQGFIRQVDDPFYGVERSMITIGLMGIPHRGPESKLHQVGLGVMRQ